MLKPGLVEEVIDAVEGHGGVDVGVGVLEPGLQRGVLGSERRKRGEVPTGRASGKCDELGVDPEFASVLPYPDDRALDVLDMRWKRDARAQAVVDVEPDPAVRREVVEQR